jgi:hypothetical protein
MHDDNDFVRVIYNGIPIDIPGIRTIGNDQIYSLHDFQALYRPMLNHCHEMP